MFLHLILCRPSPYCIPYAIIECRMTILISYVPCLAARLSPREDCSIRPLAPLFAYLRIWDSLIRQHVGSLIRWFYWMHFHFDQECCCPCCNPLSQYPHGCCQNIRVRCPHQCGLSTFTNPPIDCLEQWLVSTQIQQHLLHQCVTKAPEKTLPIQADLSWNPLPHVPLCTAAFSFFLLKLSYPAPIFCLFGVIRHLPLLGPETHSLQACLSPCPSSNRVPSLSIALEIRLFLLILRPLSSKLLFARLPHGNLGEPNTKHILRSLRIWCSVATTFSSALNAICLLLIFFYRNMTSVW